MTHTVLLGILSVSAAKLNGGRCPSTDLGASYLREYGRTSPEVLIGPATRCDEMGHFPAILSL